MARAWLQDPAFGCTGIIQQLQLQISDVESQINATQAMTTIGEYNHKSKDIGEYNHLSSISLNISTWWNKKKYPLPLSTGWKCCPRNENDMHEVSHIKALRYPFLLLEHNLLFSPLKINLPNLNWQFQIYPASQL